MGLIRSPKRAEFFAVAIILAALVGLSTRITASVSANGFSSILDLFGVNAILWFALYAILTLGLEDEDREPVRKLDWWVAGAILLACMLPTQLPALGMLVLGSAYLLLTSQGCQGARGIGVIGLALTGPLLWGSLVLRVLGPELLGFDAMLGALLSGHEVSGNVISTPDGTGDVMIGPGCSAFKNVTLVFVLTATLTRLFDLRLDRRLAGWVALAVAVTMLINGIRIASLTLYPQHFDYLHTGGGMVLFGYATLLAMALILGAAVMRRQPRAL